MKPTTIKKSQTANMRGLKQLTAALSCGIILTLNAPAVELTFRGGGNNNGSWFIPSYWNPARVPTSSDDVIIQVGKNAIIDSGLAVSRNTVIENGNATTSIYVTQTGQWNYYGQLRVGGLVESAGGFPSAIQIDRDAIVRNLGNENVIIGFNGGITVIGNAQWDNSASSLELNSNGSVLGIGDQAVVSVQSINLNHTGAFLDLGGGTLRTGGINGSGAGIKLNGVTLVATADNANFLNTAAAQTLGGNFTRATQLTFDTNGHTVTLANDFTLAASSANTTALNKTGAGTLNLSGHFNVRPNGGNVLISEGALGGSGTVSGNAITFAANTRLTPGADGEAGALTLNGSVTFADTAELLLDLATSASHDRVLSDGTLTLGDATITVNFLDTFDYQADTPYTLNLLQGVTGDHLANVQWQNLNPDWTLQTATFLNGTLTFQLEQIPEPSTWVLLLTGSVLLLSLRRRNLER